MSRVRTVALVLVALGLLLFHPSSQDAQIAHAGASELYLSQSCLSDGSVRVSFSWAGNSLSASQQWLDLSLFDNGWQFGTFLGAGPLSAQTSQLTWDGLIANRVHYVRVNQQLPNGAWDPSATFYFSTAPCGSTTPPPPPPPPPQDNCHPSYAGACLLIGIGDYDCIGGGGNGPNYTGFVRVVGPDVFDLDGDRDGFGCE
jgi:hypothetical protein